jgi:hypothetical protein
VQTSPYYPQSNGKLERDKSLKFECIRPGTQLTREDALSLMQAYVHHYNTVRLHSAIGYVTPQDMHAARETEIHAAHDRKLEEARRQRQLRRAVAAPPWPTKIMLNHRMSIVPRGGLEKFSKSGDAQKDLQDSKIAKKAISEKNEPVSPNCLPRRQPFSREFVPE